MNRAYSVLNIKSFDDDERTIEGIASTPATDRQGDIVEPLGAKFTLPLPLLWQHRSGEPVGNVVAAKVTNDGISIKAKFAKVSEPASLKEDLDRAWAMVKAKLVRGLSIGFDPIESEPIKNSFGLRYLKWEFLELSCVTIPANVNASIYTIKQYDDASRTASGAGVVGKQGPEVYVGVDYSSEPAGVSLVYGAHRTAGKIIASTDLSPGVSGKQVSDAVAAEVACALARNSQTQRGKKMKTIQEQIPAYEATRAAKFARMTEIMSKSSEEGRSLDEQETDEYDGLEREVKATDAHLVRLRAHEKSIVVTAQPVKPSVPGEGSADPSKPVTTVIHMGKSNLPKGTGFARYVKLLTATKGDEHKAAEMAKMYRDSTPEVESVLRNMANGVLTKAAMDVGTTTDTTWANPLTEYNTLASEFIDILRPATILGRLTGVRRVPFNIRVASKTQTSTVSWVGQTLPKPVSELAFGSVTLGRSKIAGIVVISEELALDSSPSAEQVIRDDLRDTIAQYMDEQFINPAVAAVANVSPASITNGATVVTSAGTTFANIMTDIKAAFAAFVAANLSPSRGVWIMSPTSALGLAMTRTGQDVFAFPDANIGGGTLLGLPIVVSDSVPGSVSGGRIIVLVDQSEIWVADEGGVRIDVSREASLQLNSAPSAGAQSLVSLWQNNDIGIRAERFVNWQRRRDGAVVYVDQVNY